MERLVFITLFLAAAPAWGHSPDAAQTAWISGLLLALLLASLTLWRQQRAGRLEGKTSSSFRRLSLQWLVLLLLYAVVCWVVVGIPLYLFFNG